MRDTAYKAIYAKEQLTKSMNRTPTIEEIAKETDISEEDIIYALDAIATPMSLFEPVYQDGNDPLFLMDQICDKKNKEETWVEHLSLQEARINFRAGNIILLKNVFLKEKPRQKLQTKSVYRRRKSAALKKNATEIHKKFY